MKKIVALALILSGLGFSAYAQVEGVKDSTKQHSAEKRNTMQGRHHQGTPEEVAKVKTEYLDKILHFTDAQRQQVYGMQLEQATKKAEQQQHLSGIRKQEYAQQNEKLMSVLTAEQKTLWSASFKKPTVKGKQARREGRPARHQSSVKKDALKDVKAAEKVQE